MCMFKTKLWKKNVTKKFVGLRKLLSLAYYGQMYYRTAAMALSNEAKSLSRCQPTLVSGNKDYKGRYILYWLMAEGVVVVALKQNKIWKRSLSTALLMEPKPTLSSLFTPSYHPSRLMIQQ